MWWLGYWMILVSVSHRWCVRMDMIVTSLMFDILMMLVVLWRLIRCFVCFHVGNVAIHFRYVCVRHYLMYISECNDVHFWVWHTTFLCVTHSISGTVSFHEGCERQAPLSRCWHQFLVDERLHQRRDWQAPRLPFMAQKGDEWPCISAQWQPWQAKCPCIEACEFPRWQIAMRQLSQPLLLPFRAHGTRKYRKLPRQCDTAGNRAGASGDPATPSVKFCWTKSMMLADWLLGDENYS